MNTCKLAVIHMELNSEEETWVYNGNTGELLGVVDPLQSAEQVQDIAPFAGDSGDEVHLVWAVNLRTGSLFLQGSAADMESALGLFKADY